MVSSGETTHSESFYGSVYGDLLVDPFGLYSSQLAVYSPSPIVGVSGLDNSPRSPRTSVFHW